MLCVVVIKSEPCYIIIGRTLHVQGSVPPLRVNATTAEHVQTTVHLASANNLRLVVKNTGHDYMGRLPAADQVLEFDVVTADGQRQTVNACQNKDLFWALHGGGGGSFAIVLTAVLCTFPSPPTISAFYGISAPNETRYSRFIRDFIRFMPILVDADCACYFHMTDTNINIGFFVPNGNFTVVTALFDQLMKNNTDLQFSVNTT
jgi:FAD/FMN-containing dehydrogenase